MKLLVIISLLIVIHSLKYKIARVQIRDDNDSVIKLLSRLETEVNEYIKLNWEPLGGIEKGSYWKKKKERRI